MPSQRERFLQWRGVQASAESKYINTAELFSIYVASVTSVDAIKRDLHSTSSPKFSEFERHGARSLGAVLFLKLALDEFVEQLPSVPECTPLRNILAKLTPLLTLFYETPGQLESAHVDELLANVGLLTRLDDSVFANRKDKEKLFFSLYTCLQLAHIRLHSLGMLAAMRIDDVKQTQKNLSELLVSIEKTTKIFVLQSQQSNEADPQAMALKALQAHFNVHYFNVLNAPPVENALVVAGASVQSSSISQRDITDKLARLETEMMRVSANIVRLLELRKSKAQLESNIQAVSRLLQVAKRNDEKVAGRAYFADFIERYNDVYQVFLANIKKDRQAVFLEKVDQLTQSIENLDLSLAVSSTLSWVNAPAIMAYRAFMPQPVQDMVAVITPATLDGQCKAMLRDFAAECLVNLNQCLDISNRQLNAVNGQLFGVEQGFMREPDALFVALQQSTNAALDAVRAYRKILASVKENANFLYTYQADSETLSEFVRINNTFWVQLSNFFAQFLSIFKTDMAKMIDKANECKRKVDELSHKYQDAITQELQQIDNDPQVTVEIKDQLKTQLNQEINAAKPKKVDGAERKINVSLLMGKLDTLFAHPPEPEVEQSVPASLSSSL